MRKLVVLGLIGGIIWLNSIDVSDGLVSRISARISQNAKHIFSYAGSDQGEVYTVTRVVDGDTIYVKNENETYTVRLLGIDTPELAHGGEPRECFAQEATQFLTTRIEGEQVRLQRDITQKDTDKYNRLLRYVYRADDKHSLNYRLVDRGYGFEYTYNIPYQKQSKFQEAQHSARVNDRGLWSPKTCDGTVSR